ncbi:glycosyltransferase [Achromobacter xylosoxidans]|nr:glycosyltransferase [Achromobacter xylosoxidans]
MSGISDSSPNSVLHARFAEDRAPQLVCATCRSSRLRSVEAVEGVKLACEDCGAVFAVNHGCPHMVDVRMLLAADAKIIGGWHVSQLNADGEYESLDEASLALGNRDDVRQVMAALEVTGKDVLDVGSGSYIEPEYFSGLGVRSLTGLDPLPPKGEPPFRLVGGMSEYLPFADGSFDVVTFITSLDHVIDVSKTMRECRRVLRPDGTVQVWVEFSTNPALASKLPTFDLLPTRPPVADNADVLAAAHAADEEYRRFLRRVENDREAYGSYLVDAYHFRHFSRESMMAEFAAAGFHLTKDVKVTYDTGGYNHVMIFAKINGESAPAPVPDAEVQPNEAVAALVESNRQLNARLDGLADTINSINSKTGYIWEIRLARLKWRLRSGASKIKRGIVQVIDCYKPITWALKQPKIEIAPGGRRILMLTISMIDIDPRINKVAHSLALAGYQVDIMSAQTEANADFLTIEDKQPGVRYIRVKAPEAWGATWTFYQPSYRKAAEQFEYDFVHANDLTTLATGAVIAADRKCPLVYDSHEMWTENVTWNRRAGKYVEMPSWKRRLARIAEGKLLKKVASFYSVSPSILDEYERRYGRRPLMLANVPDIDVLAAADVPMPSVREMSGKDENTFITLYLGGLGPARNIETVIEAHRYLDDNFLFAIRGPDAERWGADYTALARQFGIEHRVITLPGVGRDELLPGSRGADCGIVMLQNWCKNFYWFYPNKFFEYAAAGLPVAVSNFPDVSAHVAREGNGVTFDPHDARSIAEAIRNLAQDRKLAREMGARGRASVEREYNWQSAIAVMVDEYGRLSVR